MTKIKTIIVTGGTGYIGPKLVDALLEVGARALVLSIISIPAQQPY